MDPRIPYAASVLGAAALYLLLRPGPRAMKAAGSLLGLGALAWLLASVTDRLAAEGVAGAQRPEVYFAIFSLIAIAAAVRMITHGRPVYSALYFIMVVLSSAALFLLLQAEFMAFALVIVYAGAILITYMFVLMLAQQAPDPDHPQAQPEYDVVPREPGYAAGVGFIMLALFTYMVIGGGRTMPPAPSPETAAARTWRQLELMRSDLDEAVQRAAPGTRLVGDGGIMVRDGVPLVQVIRENEVTPTLVALPADAMPSNIQRVGLHLVWKFPVSLELAGVILLMAMFGAVVLARKQIELGEDEVREAAGMRRLGLHSDEMHEQPAGGTR